MKTLKTLNPGCDVCTSCCDSPFSVLSRSSLPDLNEHKTFIQLKKGDILFKEGENPRGLYCIYDGSIKLSKIGRDGREQIVRLAKKANFVGYRAMLCKDKYNATAVALEDTNVCFFHNAFWQLLIEKFPDMISETVKLLTYDLRFAENMLTNMAQKDVRGRMALTIMMLDNFFGESEKDDTIKTVIRREDIANLAGTTTETAIRTLSDFAKENMIELIGKKIKIKNRAQLLSLSGFDDNK